MIHTRGHSNGHCIVTIETSEGRIIHMGDLLPTIVHKPSLWITAYDDYPMDSIRAKENWIQQEIIRGSWFIFYHDFQYRVIKWNEQGEIELDIKRNEYTQK